MVARLVFTIRGGERLGTFLSFVPVFPKEGWEWSEWSLHLSRAAYVLKNASSRMQPWRVICSPPNLRKSDPRRRANHRPVIGRQLQTSHSSSPTEQFTWRKKVEDLAHNAVSLVCWGGERSCAEPSENNQTPNRRASGAPAKCPARRRFRRRTAKSV